MRPEQTGGLCGLGRGLRQAARRVEQAVLVALVNRGERADQRARIARYPGAAVYAGGVVECDFDTSAP